MGRGKAPTILDWPPLDAVWFQLLMRQKDPETFEGDAGLEKQAQGVSP